MRPDADAVAQFRNERRSTERDQVKEIDLSVARREFDHRTRNDTVGADIDRVLRNGARNFRIFGCGNLDQFCRVGLRRRATLVGNRRDGRYTAKEDDETVE